MPGCFRVFDDFGNEISLDNLLSLRCKVMFQTIFDETERIFIALDAQMPRQRRPPGRFSGWAEPHKWKSDAEYFRAQYFNFFDTALLLHCYTQNVELENLLLEPVSSHLAHQVGLLQDYPDIDIDRFLGPGRHDQEAEIAFINGRSICANCTAWQTAKYWTCS